MHSKWEIGWKTPFFLSFFYVLACALAIGHFGFFLYLHNREVAQSMPQSWVSSISTAFVFGFRSSLVGALGTAFTQRIWQLFRKRALKASTIDLLYTVLRNPINLLYPDLVRHAFFEFVFALLCWTIPIATVFPPGAIRIIPAEHATRQNITAFSFDPSLRVGSDGDMGRAARLQALFSITPGGAYFDRGSEIGRAIKPAFLNGRYATSPSPEACGQNCTYSITFPGPSFKCEDIPILIKSEDLNGYNGSAFAFYAWENRLNNPVTSLSEYYDPDDRLKFVLHMQTLDHTDTLRTISCDAYSSTYVLNVTYSNGVQKMVANVTRRKLLDPRRLGSPKLLTDNPNMAADFLDSQLRAVRESVVGPLVGSIAIGFGGLRFFSWDWNPSLILETPWAVSPKIAVPTEPTRIDILLTPLILEELMINCTLSVLAMGNWTTTTEAMVKRMENVYQFDKRGFIILPYGIALSLSLIFIAIGARALVSNGVSADYGGFLQVACTTTGNKVLDDAVATGCLGGAENVGKNLGRLKLQYGELITVGVAEKEGKRRRRAGFGPPGEVRPLDRSVEYGIDDDEESGEDDGDDRSPLVSRSGLGGLVFSY